MLQTTALAILQTGLNVFLTGEPGSGKSHTVNTYTQWLRERGVEPAITASTGIAATHIGGMTIHSWSGIGMHQYLSEWDLDHIASTKKVVERIISTQVLIIDEVSMLSADVLDMVDAVCRTIKKNNNPFGGIQVVLVGDFFQLPPIVKTLKRDTSLLPRSINESQTPFAFYAQSWQALNPVVCYLHEQHRQQDTQFSQILASLRKGMYEDTATIASLVSDVVDEETVTTRLYSHNANVDALNTATLEKIDGAGKVYTMTTRGPKHLVESLMRGCLSPETLTLKIGARVMFTKNDPTGKYVNGTLGEVIEFSQSQLPIVRTVKGSTLEVEPVEWKIDDSGRILARISQIPLRLAWAITIHKSQGMTLDNAVIDLSHAFEYGQGYVALSRVRSLEGLTLIGYNERALMVHPDVVIVDMKFKQNSAAARKRFEDMSTDEHTVLVEHFLTAIGATGQPVEKNKKKPVATKGASAQATLELIKEGKSITEIARERGLKTGSITSHICDLFMQGDLNHHEIEVFLPEHIQKQFHTIEAAFREYGTEKLAPVRTALDNAYSFDELQLARLLCL